MVLDVEEEVSSLSLAARHQDISNRNTARSASQAQCLALATVVQIADQHNGKVLIIF